MLCNPFVSFSAMVFFSTFLLHDKCLSSRTQMLRCHATWVSDYLLWKKYSENGVLVTPFKTRNGLMLGILAKYYLEWD